MFAGQPLTKQVSQSLITPQTLTGFAEFFRQNSNKEDGWISVKFDKEEQFRNKFFIFEDGVLSYADSEYSEFTAIPMDNVVSFKTDVSHGDPTIHITTTNRGKLTLKLSNTVEMHKWLFCFQKSVALVLTHLMRSAENRSPGQGPDSFGKGGRPKNAMPSPEKGGLALRHPDHNASTGWMGPQSMIPGAGGYLTEDGYAAFRRNGAARDVPQRVGQDGRFEFRHSDGVDSPAKTPVGSSAIPIQAPSRGAGVAIPHGHGHHAAHSHHSTGQQAQMHSRSRAHSSQSHGQRSISQDGYSSASGRESIDKLATSYKGEDDERPRLTDLLQTPSDGSPRSRGQSEDEDHQSDDSEDGDVHGDWRSKGSNEMQDDDEEEMMFDLDETAESRNSTASPVNTKMTSSAFSNASHTSSHSRQHSSESTGPGDSFYSFGKALSLSLSLAAPDHKSPSRRSSHTSHGSAQSQTQLQHAAYSPPNSSLHSGGASPKAVPYSARPGASSSSAAYSHLSRQNHSDYLMWESGYCSKVGIRDSQEDRFSFNPNINDQIRQAASSHNTAPSSSGAVSTPSQPNGTLGGGVENAGAYFGVYDGHGGQPAAIYLEKNLLANICAHRNFTHDLQGAVVDSCIRTDQDFLVECDAKRIYCGTTALGAFLIGSRLLVFNIGDCQAVLCTAGQPVEMNVPHKPGRHDESERIRKAGGWITEEKELYMYRLHRMDLSDPSVVDKANQISWVTINRVCGEISVSRSIGDPDYKRFTPGGVVNAPFIWPDNHKQIFHADLLIPDPECRVHDIGPADEFLVLASDGLWDVVSPAEAVKMIRAAFEASRTPAEAAEELVDQSIKLGSSDNVTVVITRFMHSTTSSGQNSR